MSANKEQPHVLVIPEDDACRQLAAAFQRHLPESNSRQFQVQPPSGGWRKVLDSVRKDTAGLKRFPCRLLVLVIDFDNDRERHKTVREAIGEFEDRVFVIGVLSEPEELKRSLGKRYGEIGEALARECSECRDGAPGTIWSDPLLAHNAPELQRMSPAVRPILFPGEPAAQ